MQRFRSWILLRARIHLLFLLDVHRLLEVRTPVLITICSQSSCLRGKCKDTETGERDMSSKDAGHCRDFPRSFTRDALVPQKSRRTADQLIRNPMETRPQLTSVACAVPASVQALDHVMERINELLMPETIDAAVYNDCQFVVRIHGATRRWTTKALDGAAARGRLDLVKWLSVVRTEGCTMAAINDATRNGHLEMVKWLCTHYVERCSSEALNAAAINGHIEVVKWLCGRNHGRLAYVMTSGVQAIARTGDTSALRVILRENCCWPHVGRALENAASQGLTDVVKLLLTANVRQANVNRALQNAVVMENVAIVHILTDLCSSSQLQAAYSTAMAGCNTKVIDFLGKTIEGRHVEEKWGYFRTHHKTLERIKTSRERSRIQDKSVSFCGLLRSW